eukprot:SM000035S13072  [mRNA]  locus=s35:194441:196064:- [translate_table: standard]
MARLVQELTQVAEQPAAPVRSASAIIVPAGQQRPNRQLFQDLSGFQLSRSLPASLEYGGSSDQYGGSSQFDHMGQSGGQTLPGAGSASAELQPSQQVPPVWSISSLEREEPEGVLPHGHDGHDGELEEDNAGASS